ncbi:MULTISPECIES: hypothetical protein [Alphaproteobacteria]|uniref:Uncharacterized protein n=2 Tax=Alphaproteobacteria TaxID=28211 RepID=A0A512HK11_9HYPH|nr:MULTISPECIES: hypothetical protein [Alphaproteobacteria]GEO85789.1 hypothetical protein RNA01_27210 [Ciceribacter naphthalenivorans]GLR21645.1 hypothetical protein GCM10007920_14310 [Ciceribacter naphthalenivorans]GLT04501.1 hypothetical protein GCM10007926_14310 [Sphingomonas psychrolutea]
MLATYPIAATEQNWISETLLSALRLVLETLQQGNAPPEFDAAISEEHRAVFMRGPKFQELYNAFVAKCGFLTPDQQSQVSTALIQQNNLPAVFTSTTPCCSIKDDFPEVHEAAKELFKHAFEKLSAWKTPGSELTIRATCHQVVDAHLSHGTCPFCGYEPIEAADPDLVNPDLDHYLAVSVYPFAGVNLRNLTAMGANCNRSYKGAQNILLNEHDERVDCLDPYGNEQVTLSLEGTTVLSGGGEGPTWVITFNPDNKSRNWRRIFQLEARLKSSVLEKQYKKWLEHCITYARANNIDVSTIDGVIEAVGRFKSTCAFETFPTIGRLKTSFFDLIEAELNDPARADRMHNFLIKAA